MNTKNTIAREQTEVEVDGDVYILTALPALKGMEVLSEVTPYILENNLPPPAFIRDVIMRSTHYKNRPFTEALFDTHFSKRYEAINMLFAKILEFNFGTGEVEPEDGQEGDEFPNE